MPCDQSLTVSRSGQRVARRRRRSSSSSASLAEIRNGAIVWLMIPSRGEDQPTAGRRRPGARVFLLATSLCAAAARAQAPPAAPPAPAQAPAASNAPAASPAPTPPPPVTAIPIPEVLPRADLALARLHELEAVAARPASVQEI